MQNTTKWGALLGAGAVVLMLGAGCDNNTATEPVAATDTAVEAETGEVADNVGETGQTVENAGEAVANSAEDAGDAVAQGAREVAPEIEQGAAAVGNALEPAVVTPQVKTALGANDALEGSSIDVDTLGAANTINLTGTVKSNAQKTLAAQIAQKEAKGYKINNQLKVVP